VVAISGLIKISQHFPVQLQVVLGKKWFYHLLLVVARLSRGMLSSACNVLLEQVTTYNVNTWLKK